MIKVTCKNGIEPVKEEYPCLKKSVGFERIVLFVGPKRGFELVAGLDRRSDFHYSESWAEEGFESCTGTVELSNEL